ncbi:diiron oxygenase [Pseudofrankia sp. BMG5.36]|uniref:diiron oxygenase n=1 Tax=Pseudofrankia sp. BMG5.36 TaxID=1834512 RepID=UPI0008DA27B8|nr:diiron oxygenase [Pseudofrankia sp. BMG5.36]OHV69590.1 hypothetical protein BCD48_34885 [Pseudofrankia sp. BMG5.36]
MAEKMSRHQVDTGWYVTASVRRSQRHLVADDTDRNALYYPRSVAKVVSHPLIAGNDDVVRDVLALSLMHYLDSTVVLEQQIVNPCFLTICDDQLPVSLPAEARSRAYMYYCDEAYHALCADDLGTQVRERTGLALTKRTPGFLIDLGDALLQVSGDHLRALVELAFTIVSETLISQSLLRIPADPTVVPAVRASVADHARDEKNHHAYFARFLPVFWPLLDSRTQEALGRLFPRFIRSFLEPDRTALAFILRQYVTAEEAEIIITETYPPTVVDSDVRAAARATLNLCERTGMMRIPAIASEFERAHLVRVPHH